MVGGRKHTSCSKKFVVPRRNSAEFIVKTEAETEENLELDASHACTQSPSSPNLVKIKVEVNNESLLSTSQTLADSKNDGRSVSSLVERSNVEDDSSPHIGQSTPTVVEDPTDIVDYVSPRNLQDPPLTESTLSTIDAANLGIHFWANGESERIPIVPVAQPKKRGRKPKAKSVTVDNETMKALMPGTDMRFPQSILNGIISIDMSSLRINNDERSDIHVTTDETAQTAVVKIENILPGKKLDPTSKPKRGRPKRPKQEEPSSATSSPVKKSAKRGRKIKDSATAPPEQGVWSSKKILEYVPEDYHKFEQEQVLSSEDWEGFKDVEVFNFYESEFHKNSKALQDGCSTWWPIHGNNVELLRVKTDLLTAEL